ncbi:peptidase family M1-domain-containing protein [Entophlyctis helioformis]|nr:peptidase family M1-domain-containing protein [Entophlyctis helioformis]
MCYCHASPETAAAGTPAPAARDVLPANVKPSHYDLSLTPNFDTFVFDGTVAVSLDVKEDTTTIVANASELTIKSAKVVVTHVKTESTQTAKAITTNQEAETVTFEFDNALPAGAKAVLTIEFTGIHNDKMAGFYRSGYTDKDGNKRYLVSTQFEATDARRAFPCWDEPNLKATFDATLVIDAALTGLGNMNVVDEKVSEVDGKAIKTIKFARTPIMSTYILAFCVGDFEFVETESKPKTPADAKPIKCRVYALKGQGEKGLFANEVSARVLEYFSEFFDCAYPLPKMDMVAIPDFAAGAMENWGLVTYRETALLVSSQTSVSAKQGVAYVVGHELAHQWFGNLVTMDWWNELWLNEGFATFVGWQATNHVFPEWKVWTQFVSNDFARGLGLDALRSSHPIEVDVKHPSEINQIFDAISYSKGASVIRMLSAFLGADVFANGVRAYLKKFAYSNARTVDLWAALSGASGQDVAKLMYAWTREMGFPIITIKDESFDATKQELTVTVHQTRFLASGDLTAEEEAKSTIWSVPLTIVTHVNPHSPVRYLLTEKEAKITFPYSQVTGNYYKFNYQTTGFYRVGLSAKQQSSFGEALKLHFNNLTSEDRIGILSDAFATARAGLSTTAGVLDIVKSFAAEDNYFVLSELDTRLSQLVSLYYKDKDILEGIYALQRSIFSPKAAKVGFEYLDTEDDVAHLKRTLVLRRAASAGDAAVIAEFQRRFKLSLAGDDKAFHSNLRGAIFYTVMTNSTSTAEFEAILDIFKTTTDAQVRSVALGVLGSSPDIEIAHRVLAMALDQEQIRLQDSVYIVSSVAMAPPKEAVYPLLWTWLKANWDTLHVNLKSSLGLLGGTVSIVVSVQIGDEFADEVEAWSRGDDLAAEDAKAKRVDQMKAVTAPLKQAVERVRGSTKWYKSDREGVAAWFTENKF